MRIVAGIAGVERNGAPTVTRAPPWHMEYMILRRPVTLRMKLVALLDNRPVMRIFERVRSVFALPTRMTGKSSMSKESTRDAQVAGYHL